MRQKMVKGERTKWVNETRQDETSQTVIELNEREKNMKKQNENEKERTHLYAIITDIWR